MGTVDPVAQPDWLAQLAPPHAPPPVGWWPLAPGWWGLFLLVLAALVGFWFWYRRPSLRLRRSGMRELATIESTAVGNAALAHALEQLVRRYAVVRYGREAVAGLSGRHWLDFAIARGATQWKGAAGESLLQAAYGGTPQQADRLAWIAGARAFLRGRT